VERAVLDTHALGAVLGAGRGYETARGDETAHGACEGGRAAHDHAIVLHLQIEIQSR